MGSTDFPSWFGAGVYGGLASAALSALVIAGWALLRHRGMSGQVVVALLTCLIASVVDAAPIYWAQYRLGVYGPTLSVGEVAAALVVTALAGWAAPLGAMTWYVLYAVPLSDGPLVLARSQAASMSRLMDPARRRLALPEGQSWGKLITTPPATNSRAIILARELILIGRDPGNDLIVVDDRVSRYHAELRWENGQPCLVDLASLNGTRVNQMAVVGRTILHHGDLIEVGEHHYLFENQTELQALNGSGGATHGDVSPEAVETRKTAGVSGSFGSSAPALELVWERGSALAGQWTLKAPVTTIGRDASCGLALPDDSVSRAHAQITRQPDGYFVADLESSNGVFLNGSQVMRPTKLVAGDVLRLGDVTLAVREATPKEAHAGAAQQDLLNEAQELTEPRMRSGGQVIGQAQRTLPRLAPDEPAPAEDEHRSG